MVFADLFFIYVFLPLCLICYGLAKKLSTKNIVLIVFSLIFYAWGEPLWILLLLFSSFFNWFIGILIGKFRDTPRAKLAVGGGIFVDILLLLIFKYSAFIVENLNAVSGAAIPVPQITLPIGISFYTFQAISYILDCYWETVDVQPKYHKFLLYLSLFPQLIAGPIVRYSVVEQEIDNRSVNATDLCEGALRVILGLAKKVIIANNLWSIVNTFFGKDITGLSVLGTWYTIIVYSLYVYFDFSGYSDIAIGLGRMFGFHFDENFRHPFACTTIAEFWQRWHISLGSFFRDYVYIPLGGKKKHQILNMAIVWALTEFDTVKDVNFLVDGQRRDTLTHGTNISGSYTRVGLNQEETAQEVFGGASEVQLYFPAQDGRLLVPVSRTVYSSDDVATAVFEFLRGPRADSGLETPLPQETQLLGVSVENGVVTINFSKGFTRIAEQSDGGMQAMRALMLTCTRYPGIKRVKILVDGEPYQMPTQDMPTFANVASEVESSFPEVMVIE